MSAIDVALARLHESGNVLTAYFPGPFDDFRKATIASSANEVFSQVEASLDTASTLSDVPGLFALAYADSAIGPRSGKRVADTKSAR